MKAIFSLAALLATLPATAAPALPDRIGEQCSGSETLRSGAEAPNQVPYRIALSIDLASRTYCDAACGKDQTYPIRAVAGPVITLSDVDIPGQSRRMVFDRGTNRLTDVQHIAMGAIAVSRDAQARCAPAPFHAPFGSKG